MGDYSGTLPTPAAGSAVTDTEMIGQILGLLSAIAGPWTPYDPGWFATSDPSIGDGTIEGAYRRTGNYGELVMRIAAGASTTFGSGSYEFQMPTGWNVPAGAWANNHGFAAVFDSSANAYFVGNVGAVLTNANRFRIRPHSLGNLNATNLVTLANQDTIMAHIFAELT